MPMPYTIYITKNVNNLECVDKLYLLLGKFGTHIKDSFFKISIEIVKQIFDLIQDYKYYINSDKYIIVQDNIEYIIPKSDCNEETLFVSSYNSCNFELPLPKITTLFSKF